MNRLSGMLMMMVGAWVLGRIAGIVTLPVFFYIMAGIWLIDRGARRLTEPAAE